MFVGAVSPRSLPGACVERLFASPLLMSARACSLISDFSSSGFLFSSLPLKELGRRRSGYGSRSLIIAALDEDKSSSSLAGLIFQPFEEVKSDSFLLPSSLNASLARQKYTDECEAAINEQINVEYNVSYVYHSLFAYFDRDNIALRGLAKFFKESSEEEREHAEKLMKYQNMRGGRVKLYSMVMPPSEFEHTEKGDALHAMQLALSLEKLTNEKLLNLHSVAEKNNDVQLQEFVEGEFLTEQVEAIKKIAEYVAQLRLVGKGHGVWHFDQMLLQEGESSMASL
ncbi:hypothetical protein V2J09_010112 [Rumex salicifolius]